MLLNPITLHKSFEWILSSLSWTFMKQLHCPFTFMAQVTQGFILSILVNATSILTNETKVHFAPSFHIICNQWKLLLELFLL